MNTIAAWLSTLSGPLVFGAAYYMHQKVRLTRAACVVAALAGFMTFAGPVGTWVNGFAAQLGILSAVGTLIGVAIIVADIKGKKKGADRPALFAFYFVPLFIVAGLAALPALFDQASTGLEKVGDRVSATVEQ